MKKSSTDSRIYPKATHANLRWGLSPIHVTTSSVTLL